MGDTKRKDDSARSIAYLLKPLLAAQQKITHFANQGVIIGGIAVRLLGKPRFTADADMVI